MRSDGSSEVSAIKLMAGMRADGMSLRQIAAALEAEGIGTKKGGRWHANTVGRILARVAESA